MLRKFVKFMKISISEEKRVFSATLAELPSMLLWIKEGAKDAHIPRNELKKVELASEEALVNIIRHGYKLREGNIEITRNLINPKYLEIIIKDQGDFFNPLDENIKINKRASLEDRTEGGLGILLIKKYMSDVIYKRENNYNILILRKKF